MRGTFLFKGIALCCEVCALCGLRACADGLDGGRLCFHGGTCVSGGGWDEFRENQGVCLSVGDEDGRVGGGVCSDVCKSKGSGQGAKKDLQGRIRMNGRKHQDETPQKHANLGDMHGRKGVCYK